MAVPLNGSAGATEVYSQRLDRLNEKFSWLQQRLRAAGASGAGNGLVSGIFSLFHLILFKLVIYNQFWIYKTDGKIKNSCTAEIFL